SLACSGGRPVRVRDAMSREPFIVGPESPISAVARLMADARVGSAVVMSAGQVVGILCAFDALNALARLTTPRPAV
ncbi:MAG: CBS domain-containing protein, partial [Polyangiales bacterium]